MDFSISTVARNDKMAPNDNKEDVETSALVTLQESLDLIATAEKAAYLEAVQRAPEIVETESDPMCFLRHDDFNCWTAASRLVSYWEERTKAFGDEAFLPLRQALSKEAIGTLREGTIVVLPHDSQGRSVFCVANPKRMKTKSAKARIQIVFYLCHLAMRNPFSTTNGIVILSCMDTLSFHRNTKIDMHIFGTVMPVRAHAAHFLCKIDATPARARDEIVRIVLQATSRIAEKKIYIHHCQTEQARADKLVQFGLQKKRLPEFLGGTWKIGKHWEEQSNSPPNSPPPRSSSEQRPRMKRTVAVVHTPPPVLHIATTTSTPKKTTKQEVIQIRKAIERLPLLKKTAFLEAMRIDPSLLETESNPVRFLQHDNYNFKTAARRLVLFWEERKKAFGDKAFLPLTYESYSEETTRSLYEGAFLILPNDKRGRIVVFRDEKKISNLSLKARLQLNFFLDYVSRSDPQSSEEGIVMLTIMDRISFDRNSKLCSRASKNAMPTRVHSFHVLCNSSSEADGMALGLFGWLVDDNKTHIHVCRTIEERAMKLLPFGLERDRLPQFLGGSAEFMPWLGAVEKIQWDGVSSFSVTANWGPIYKKYGNKVEPRGSPSLAVPDVSSSSMTTIRPSSIKSRIEPTPTQARTEQALLNTPEKHSLDSLKKAIAEIPVFKKAAYLDALKLAPHLIQTEANLIWFLKRENFDLWAAARRVVSYWKERKNTFGDKAFFSLTDLGGDHPYSDETMRALRSGAYVLLPNDSDGRTVFHRDADKLRPLSLNARKQILFYWCAQATFNDKSVTEGYVVVTTMDWMTPDRNTNITMHMCKSIMPIKGHSCHIICKNVSIGDGVVPLALMLLRFFLKNKSYVHSCQTAEDCAAKLFPYGITKEGLPRELGGFWEATQRVDSSNMTASVENKASSTNIKTNYEPSIIDLLFPDPVAEANPEVSSFSALNIDNQMSASVVGSKRKIGENSEEVVVKKHQRQPIIDKPSLRAIPQVSTFSAPTSEVFTNVQVGRIEDGSSNAKEPNSKPNKKSVKSLPEGFNMIGIKDTDVLLGKGRLHEKHNGNQCLKYLVELHSDRLDAKLSRKEAKRLRQVIYDDITKEKKARFMKFDTDTKKWTELSMSYALEKIGESVRNYRRKT